MKKLRIVEAHQVPKGNISPDIFKLPCVDWAAKDVDGSIGYRLLDSAIVENTRRIARAGFWICKDSDGKWRVLTSEEYRKICNDTPKEYQPIRGC